MIQKISIIGTGNVGTHLAHIFQQTGYQIVSVFNKDINKAQTLAKQVSSVGIDNLSAIQESDFYFICVKDDAISDISEQLNIKKGMVVHSSGSTDMNILNRHKNGYGVFYPFQTISKNKDVDFSTIPIFIEADNQTNKNLLTNLANTISNNVQEANSDVRLSLHIAGVFVSNFVNHLYQIGYELLAQKGLDFDLLKPLIREVCDKVMTTTPIQAQTGPASRKDTKIIEKHINHLANEKIYKDLYLLISNSILKY